MESRLPVFRTRVVEELTELVHGHADIRSRSALCIKEGSDHRPIMRSPLVFRVRVIFRMRAVGLGQGDRGIGGGRFRSEVIRVPRVTFQDVLDILALM